MSALLGRLAVLFVVFLITYIPISSQIFIFYTWLSFRSEWNVYKWLGPFNVVVLSIWINYFLACTSDPGAVPPDYDPRKHDGDKKTFTNLPGATIVENAIDVYSRWIIIALGSTTVSATETMATLYASYSTAVIYNLALIGLRMWDLIKYQEYIGSNHLPHAGYFYTPPASNTELVVMVLNMAVLFILLFTVGILSIWQLYFVCCNTTTIESSENAKIQELIRKNKVSSDATYPYDLGMLGNLKAVFGKNVLLWCLPQPATGDGLSFDIDPALLEGDEDITWPPVEYYENRKRAVPVQENSRRHIRRGSEGYLVKEWTEEERERMVQSAERRSREDEDYGEGSDIDDEEGDDDDDDDEVSDSDSDNETLAQKQERYLKRDSVDDITSKKDK
ncbi:Palmitoyltransferase [Phlyctochytrium planicorne]|nr:Palmitoyltransferase [Phlyctochytrium planicorne]